MTGGSKKIREISQCSGRERGLTTLKKSHLFLTTLKKTKRKERRNSNGKYLFEEINCQNIQPALHSLIVLNASLCDRVIS